jgi:hypothetical protein
MDDLERMVSKMIKSSKTKVNQSVDIFDSSLNGWDEAIRYAKEELSKAKFRVAQLKAAMRMLADQKLSGTPWPGMTGKNTSKGNKLS